MATMIDNKPTQYQGEAYVWQCIKDNLWDEVVCYYNRQINNREFDFCLLIKDVGLVILEVKGWIPEHISKVVSPDEICLSDGSVAYSPKKQVRSYAFSLKNIMNEKYNISPNIMEIVCYPFLSKKDFNRLGLYIVSEEEYTLFNEDISSSQSFNQKILNVYENTNHSVYDAMRNNIYDICRHHFEPSYVVKPPMDTAIPYSTLSVYSESISLSAIDNILDSYFKGTKQIIFTNSQEDTEIIAKYLSDRICQKNIIIDGNNFTIGNGTLNKIAISNSKFSIFNFEVYCISNFTIPTSFTVYNGVYNDEQKALLMELSKHSLFNINQFEIEHAKINHNIQIRAGAGTGKTYSMVSRIAFLCHESSNSGIYDIANEIAMLTFTSDAATNMKTRLKKMFTNYFLITGNIKYLEFVSSVEKMHISTIHSFAKEIIQISSLSLGIGTNFVTVSGNYDRTKIFDKALNDYLQEKNEKEPIFFENIPFDIHELRKHFLSFSGLLYNKGCDIKEVPIEAFGKPIDELPYINDIFEKVVKRAEIEYTQFLFDNNAVRLSEYMLYLRKCISDDAFNKNMFQFKYVFIDEFQDTDDAQIISFVEMQKKLGFYFFIVGDLKQSIYRFRGATMDAFKKMGCEGKDWLLFSLNINYRSDKRLLSRYDNIFYNLGEIGLLPYDSNVDKLIGIKENINYNNDKLVMKIPYASGDLKTNVYTDKLFKSISEQKSNIEMQMQLKNLSLNERTIAILVRNNRDINFILKAAKKKYATKEINYDIQSDSSGDLYSLDCAIDLCKLTSAICNPYNLSYLYDLIQSNNINVEFSLSAIAKKSKNEKLKILTNCLDQFYMETLNLTWEKLIFKMQNEPVLKTLRIIYEATKPWKNYSSDGYKQSYYRTNYELVFEELSALNKRNYLTLDSINESLHIAITTGTETKSRGLQSDTNGVRIICTTVHKSKGLEYGTIILPFSDFGIDEPHKNKIDATYIDGKIGYCISGKGAYEHYYNEYYPFDTELKETAMEETRLLYVALTRAINSLVWFHRIDCEKNCWGNLLKEM